MSAWLALVFTDAIAVTTFARCFTGPGELTAALVSLLFAHLAGLAARGGVSAIRRDRPPRTRRERRQGWRDWRAAPGSRREGLASLSGRLVDTRRSRGRLPADRDRARVHVLLGSARSCHLARHAQRPPGRLARLLLQSRSGARAAGSRAGGCVGIWRRWAGCRADLVQAEGPGCLRAHARPRAVPLRLCPGHGRLASARSRLHRRDGLLVPRRHRPRPRACARSPHCLAGLRASASGAAPRPTGRGQWCCEWRSWLPLQQRSSA